MTLKGKSPRFSRAYCWASATCTPCSASYFKL